MDEPSKPNEHNQYNFIARSKKLGKGQKVSMTEKKRFEILLEDIQEKVNTLVEGQQISIEYVNKRFGEFEERILERFEITDLKILALKERLDKVEKEMTKLRENVEVLKVDVAEIKKMLNRVVIKEDLIIIERRIERLEAAVF